MCIYFYKLITNFSCINNYRSLHKYIYQMNKAYFRYEDEKQFKFTFEYVNSALNVDKQFSFCRQRTESVSTFLSRVSTNVEKAFNKKNKRKKGEQNVEPVNINVSLLLNNVEVNGDTLCDDVFKEDNNVVLKLLENKYTIVINSPWIEKIALPNSLLANYPAYPSKLEYVFMDQTLSEFNWYKSANKSDWIKVGDGFVYIPSNEEINSYLKLSCIPKNATTEGPSVETVTEVVVQAGPGVCPFEIRHQFTQQRTKEKEFRVVTYNILADLYCDSDFSRTVLHPYCPPYALNIDYRKQLILKELLGYNADIICLQEVDRKVYKYDFQPVFSSLKYESTFQLKGGEVAEGLACLFNGERFRFLETHSIVLGEELNKDSRFADIWEKISGNEKLCERILQRTTTVQTVALESKEHNEIILVANTHLYFHPDADHIRLLQGGLTIRYIQDVMEKLQQKNRNKRVSLIYCGDFNSVPECGIYQLYTTGSVTEDCIDWQSNTEEAVRNVGLTQPLKLASACGTPQFTNFTAGFRACLDYIFYDTTKLEVTQVIPLPSLEELSQHTALPSVVFPSDHISLVSDLKWL